MKYQDIIVHIDNQEDFVKSFKEHTFKIKTPNEINLLPEARIYYQYKDEIWGWTYVKKLERTFEGFEITPTFNIHRFTDRVPYKDFNSFRFFNLNHYLREYNSKDRTYDFSQPNPDILTEDFVLGKYRLLGHGIENLKIFRLIESDSNSIIPYDEDIEAFVDKINEYCYSHKLKVGDKFVWEDVVAEFGNVNFDFTVDFECDFEIAAPNNETGYFDLINSTINSGDSIAESVYFYFSITYFETEDKYFSRTDIGNIYHEFHHCKEEIERVSNYKPSIVDVMGQENFFNQNEYVSRFKMRVKTPKDALDKNLFLFVYRLFRPSESTALGPQVYGELKAMKSKKENFSYDIWKTDAYQNYKVLEMRYRRYKEPHEHIPDNELSPLKELEIEHNAWDPTWNWVESAKVLFDKEFKNNHEFKQWFLYIAKKNLDKMFRIIMRNANAYYRKYDS